MLVRQNSLLSRPMNLELALHRIKDCAVRWVFGNDGLWRWVQTVQINLECEVIEKIADLCLGGGGVSIENKVCAFLSLGRLGLTGLGCHRVPPVSNQHK